MHIRSATIHDRDAVRSVHWAAFPEGERELVAALAVNLLSEQSVPRTISLVAEIEGAVVGHVAFSPVTIGREDIQGYILAPLAVKPDHQKRRVGSRLVLGGIGQLTDMGVDILLVYGDPQYYGRFGFTVDAADRYIPPYKLPYPFGWQGRALKPCGAERSPVGITCVPSLGDPSLW